VRRAALLALLALSLTAYLVLGSSPESAAREISSPSHSAPIQLTASDGTGLHLVEIEARGVLEPPLAFTELFLTFENPRPETIEGRFRIALPPGAALSRFAMKIGGHWQEGEVVEKQRARQVYEDFLHRRQDPALLEQEAGNEFSARVFPIPARGRKEIAVSYSHALPGAHDTYAIPLLGLPEIKALDIRVYLSDRPAEGPASNLGGERRKQNTIELHREDWTPDRDFEIAQEEVGPRLGLRHENLAVARIAPTVESRPQEIEGLFVLFDSSASRALGYGDQVRLLQELMARLAGDLGASIPLGVAAFDQELEIVFEGTLGAFGPDEANRLTARQALGASDLEGALADLARHLSKRDGRYPRVLVMSDGVATAGETEGRDLIKAVRELGEAGAERLDALVVGGIRDPAALRQLTTGILVDDGQVIDGTASLDEIVRRLSLACRSDIEIAVEGSAWVWPQELDGVQPGDEFLIYADLPADQPLEVRLDGRRYDLGPDDLGPGELAEVERPLLERAWVQARIERLLHLRETAHADDPDLRRALAGQVATLSVEHRVMSPFTSFLVLETENDYRRYGLDRRALADILTVGPGGLEVLARATPPPAPPAPRAKIAIDNFEGGEDRDELRALGYVNGGRESSGTENASIVSENERIADLQEEAAHLEEELMALESGTAAPPAPRREPAPEPILEEIVVNRQLEDGTVVDRISAPATSEHIEQEPSKADPYTGRYAEVMAQLAANRTKEALKLAQSWRAEAAGDVLALIALGESWEAAGDLSAAARAYGSLIDLYPGRVDLRRYAGERLERLGEIGAELRIDTYRKAVADRPDHPSGHRLLAWALLESGDVEGAFETLEAALERSYPAGRFAGVDRIMKEDLGLAAAAWLREEPERRSEILRRLRTRGARLEDEPSLRFVLTWETDANDVDLHVWDARGGHAYYSQPKLASGGRLYADVTTGYGPECFTIPGGAEKRATPYELQAHYYRRGPMGYGLGTLQVVEHDGHGGLRVDPRPFVVMVDDAFVDLGSVE